MPTPTAPAGYLTTKDAMKLTGMTRQGLIYFCARFKLAIKKVKYGSLHHYFFPQTGIKANLSKKQVRKSAPFKLDINKTIKTERTLMVYYPKHPRATTSGLVPQHLLLVEEVIGRPVRKDERVHHIDGKSHNNRLSNLCLRTTDKKVLARKFKNLQVEARA